MTKIDFPPHSHDVVPWRQAARGGTKADRMLSEITVAIPPRIADIDYAPTTDAHTAMLDAEQEIIRTDAGAGGKLQSLGRFLIRTESVSSSKIEQVEADADDFVRAIAGIRANASATSMVAATDALTKMVETAGTTGAIALDDVLAAHEVLMRDDPTDGRYAGQLRTVQNWIGGSDYSPRGAVHVPPPPALVPELMADLLVYANRDDVPAIVQAAGVHAQFESIHPFTDGNGRIGRALINAVLRRRSLTTTTVVPIASAMVADQAGYFGLVNRYRDGYLGDFAASLAKSAVIAAQESRVSADNLLALPAEWAALTSFRRNSAGAIIVDALLDHPVLTVDSAIAITGKTDAPVYAAMSRLVDDGIVHEVTGRKRDKIWAATEVVAELDELNSRILARARA
jgi:Fic family protein